MQQRAGFGWRDGYVLIWCAGCEATYRTPAPSSLWSWIEDHRRFGMCRRSN